MKYSRSKTLNEVIRKRLRRGLHSDQLIKLDDNTRLQVHRLILAENSPFFEAIFKYTPEKYEKSLSWVSGESFKVIISLIYCRSSKINNTNVQQILVDSDYLDFPVVGKKCEEVIIKFLRAGQTTRSQFENLMNFAKDFNLFKVEEICKEHLEEYYDSSFIEGERNHY